jgi:transcriptional regulator with XRE-family HTH domain
MPRTPPALVTPALLRWARDSYGLDVAEAARRLHIQEERLLAWESGSERPTVAQLRRLAEIYKRPLAVFYLPSPPRDFQPFRDFRRLPRKESLQGFSAVLRREIQRIVQLREAALDLYEPEQTLTFRAPREDNPEFLAARLRTLLNVSQAS